MILNLTYGGGRRLRVVNWTIARLAVWSIQDTRIHDLWTRQGPPTEALLVDVILHKNRHLFASTVALVLEHPTFDPVPAGNVIPEQPVVLLDMASAMAAIKDIPPYETD